MDLIWMNQIQVAEPLAKFHAKITKLVGSGIMRKTLILSG